MSFSRAQVKRFNDSKASGPAPGSYDVKDLKHSAGVLPFETGGVRFRKEEAAAKDESEGSSAFVAPSMPAPVSKKRLNFGAQNQNESKSGKGTPRQSPTINKEKETYEKEIRRLLHQVNEQDKKLTTKSGVNTSPLVVGGVTNYLHLFEIFLFLGTNSTCCIIISFRFLKEIQKLENRISLLVKEKCSLSGKVIFADKKVSELNKRNLLLESQNSMQTEKQQAREELENELKKTKSKHETAKQELDKSKTMLVAMQSDLDGALSTISALQKSNSELRQLNNETQQHTDDVGIQLTKLQRLVDDLRTEKNSAEQQLSAIKQRFEAVEKEFTELLQTKADGIKKQFEEKQLVMVADLDRARNEAADSNTRCSELQNKVDILKDERDDISCKKAELEEKIKSMDEERSSLKESFSQQTVKLNECKCALEETEKDRDDMKDEVSDLTSLVERKFHTAHL